MKVFFIDDSNISFDQKLKFFIYGGLVVDEINILNLVKFLHDLKEVYGIKQERPIKWYNINWNKEGEFKKEKHDKIKNEILNFVAQSPCEIIIYLASHYFYHKLDIIKWPEIKYRIDIEKKIKSLKFALNACLQKFDYHLAKENNMGLVIADEFGEGMIKYKLINYCFTLCPQGTQKSTLNHIVYPIITIDSEYSAVHQINDIVLGAIQYSLREQAHNFIPLIRDKFWKENNQIFGYGINIYPKRTDSLYIQEELDTIEQKFKRLI